MEKYGKAFKELTFREKVEYLWEYYRWPAVGSIVVVVGIISLIIAIITPPKVYSVDITIAGQLTYDDTHPEVVQYFEDEFDTGLNVGIVNWTKMGEMEMAMMQRIPLLITTKELDILCISTEAFDSYLRQTGNDMFVPLEEISEFKELLEKYEGQLFIAGYNKDEDFNITEGAQHVYGIRVNTIDNIPSMTLNEEMVIGVTTTAKDIQKTADMIEYLLESK